MKWWGLPPGLALAAVPWLSAASRPVHGLSRLPMVFERNQGQGPRWAQYIARGPGYLLALSGGEAVLSFGDAHAARAQIRMKFVGADPRSGEASQALPGLSHYFLGRDPSSWHTRVRQFARVRFANVYPGISAAFYGNEGQLEYDFEVAPGADPNRIELQFDGAGGIEVEGNDDLVMKLGTGEARLRPPSIYQRIQGKLRKVHGRHRVSGNRVRFELQEYDPRYALVIDPVLVYSVALSGGRPTLSDVAFDNDGNTYATGCAAPGLSLVNAYLEDFTTQDVIVTKLSADGATLLYSTYLGGGCGSAIALDTAGNILVAGATPSRLFPVRNPAFSRPGGAFLAKLSADGSELIYSTYLGGDANDLVSGMAVDGAGNAIVTGSTLYSGFRTTISLTPVEAPDQGEPRPHTAFVAKYSPTGDLLYSASLGKGVGANAVAADSAGAAYVAGATCGDLSPVSTQELVPVHKDCDAFVTKVLPNGDGLAWSMALGGSEWDGATRIAIDAENNAYVTGITFSSDFPVTPTALQSRLKGTWDAFAAKIDAAGARVVYATYLGGNREETPNGIAVDGAGRAILLGATTSGDWPAVDALRPKRNGAAEDLHISNDGGRTWTTLAPHAAEPRGYRPWRGSLFSLAAAPGDPLTVYAADRYAVYRSSDGGLTWTTASADPGQPPILALAVHPANSAAVYAISATGIAYSSDRGATWTELGELNVTGASREVNLLLSGSSANILHVFLRRSADPALLKSVDGGQTWNGAGELPRGAQAAAVDPSDENILYVGADAGIYKSVDGGLTWQILEGTGCAAGCQYLDLVVARYNPRVLIFTRRGGRDYGYNNQQCEFHKSTDGGRTWTSSTLPVLADATALALDPADPNTIYLGLGGNGVHKSSDGGVTWKSISASAPFWTDPVNAIAAVPAQPSQVLIATSTSNEGFLAMLNPEGSALIHSTYLGGPGTDSIFGLRADATGAYFVQGASVVRLEYDNISGCKLALTPLQVNAHFQGSATRVQVQTASGCQWGTESGAPWIEVVSPQSGEGMGMVEFVAAANKTGSPRSEKLLIGGESVTVTQGGGPPCVLTPQPVRAVGNGLTRDGFSLDYTSGCKWKAASNVPWITLGTGAGGAATWVIPYTVEANTGRSARRGTITITAAGETAAAVHTVLQSGTQCTVKVAGSSERVAAAGGVVTLQLESTPGDCAAWLADSGASWAAPVPGTVPAGIGNGSAIFRVTANTQPLERSTRLQMGGQGVRVTQDAVACAYRLAPPTQSVDAAQFTSILNVMAPAGCTWTAVSDNSWIRITSVVPARATSYSGTPTGNGRVNYRVDANTSGATRTGALTVAGQTFIVTQAAAEPEP